MVFKELKPKINIIQYKNPNNGKWENYALTYSKAIAEAMVKIYNDYYNYEWRIKPTNDK